jgi:signal transduction histidine kinase
MDINTKPFKIALLAIMLVIVTIMHYATGREQLSQHLFHRELYFIPILLASLWFGLKPGLIVSGLISFIYVSHLLLLNDAPNKLYLVGIQILIFNLVALTLGWLVDRRKRQQAQALAVENLAVLGRAATAVGHEMNDLLGALKRMAHMARGLQCTELDRDFDHEMVRLENMVEVLSSFAPPQRERMFSYDLNKIIPEKLGHHKDAARKAGITFNIRLDEKGCPSRVSTKSIGWVLGRLIQNAIESSSRGQAIHIHSVRGGQNCKIEVRDEGTGIQPEHLAKIFTPFFTTKEKGQGLSLAGCRRILRDMGGDLQVVSKWGEGAGFTMIIPREYSGKPLAEDPVTAVVRGHSNSQIYRE